jgi:hypothetical protein
MALRLIRRHLKTCPHTSTRYRRCRCPIHVYGTLGGEKVRKALDQTSWEAATELINAWTESGEIGVVKPQVPTISEAVAKFLHDLEHGQKRKAATLQKHTNLLEKRLLPWCAFKGYRLLKQLDVDAVASSALGGPIRLSRRRRTSNASGRSSGSVTALGG